VHALAGIGNPQRFFATLRALGIVLIEHAFPDHHAYVRGDLAFDDDLPVLMTEKDAVKCRPYADARMAYLAVRARLAPGLDALIAKRLKEHKRGR
jgi:tetraacyldisaccharide 4'-kinase